MYAQVLVLYLRINCNELCKELEFTNLIQIEEQNDRKWNFGSKKKVENEPIYQAH